MLFLGCRTRVSSFVFSLIFNLVLLSSGPRVDGVLLSRVEEEGERVATSLEPDFCPLSRSFSLSATCLHELGRKDEAEDCFRALLEENPDCHEYYKAFLNNKGLDLGSSQLFFLVLVYRSSYRLNLIIAFVIPPTDNVTDETRPKILRAFELLSSLYPRASAPRRIALNYATGTFRVPPSHSLPLSELNLLRCSSFRSRIPNSRRSLPHRWPRTRSSLPLL